MFPVIISAPNPFYHFTRNSDDCFELDIPKVNTAKYDALKLHRVSFFQDVGLEHEVPMGFGFDGSMLIPRDKLTPSADVAIAKFNKVKASLFIGGITLNQTTVESLAFGELSEYGYFRYMHALGSTSQIAMALSEGNAGILNIEMLDARKISKEKFESAYLAGEKLVNALGNVDTQYLLTSVNSYNEGNYRITLLFGWIVIEQLIDKLWSELFLKKEIYFVNKERRKTVNSIMRNVGQKIEMLHQTLILREEEYNAIFQSRKARNKFIHSGGSVNKRDAFACIYSVFKLLDILCIEFGMAKVSENILEQLGKNSIPIRSDVARAGELDWSKVSAYRLLYKIPGDRDWNGDYAAIDGIHLEALKPTSGS